MFQNLTHKTYNYIYPKQAMYDSTAIGPQSLKFICFFSVKTRKT